MTWVTAYWDRSFRARHGVVAKTVSGEEAVATPMKDVVNWRKREPERVREAYKPDDSFNTDETALLCELLPERTTLVVKCD